VGGLLRPGKDAARGSAEAEHHALSDREVQARLEPLGFTVILQDLQTADRRFRSDIERWRTRVDAIGFTIQ
jgi:hypothetical protein